MEEYDHFFQRLWLFLFLFFVCPFIWFAFLGLYSVTLSEKYAVAAMQMKYKRLSLGKIYKNENRSLGLTKTLDMPCCFLIEFDRHLPE